MNEQATAAHTWVSLTDITLKGERLKRGHPVWFCFYKIHKQAKLAYDVRNQGNGFQEAGGKGLSGIGSFLEYLKVLFLDVGDG